MQTFEKDITNLEQLPLVAKELLAAFPQARVFAFYAEMGAGKTTFIKALCKAIGVTGIVTSPTFALVNEYNAGNNKRVYHFDFYRINKPEEVFDFGSEEYFASNNYCFVEWPEKAEIVLPQDICKVKITELPNGNRQVLLMTVSS